MDIRAIVIIAAMLGLLYLVIVGLGSALVPLLIAFGLAYLLFPLIKKIEKFGIKRHYTVSGVFLLLTLIGSLLFLTIVPELYSDAKNFLQELPDNTIKVIDKLEIIAGDYGYRSDISKESLKAFIIGHTSDVSGSFLKGVGSTISGVFTSGTHWLLLILNIFLIPLFFFYMVNDFEKLSNGLKSYIPLSMLPKISHYSKLGNEVLSGYIRGQLLVAVILSVLYGVGLFIAGVRFGILIGFVSGLISIIPYAGFTLGFLAAIMIGLANYNGMGPIIGILIVFVVVQTLEGTIITPKLVGNKVGLSAFATMLALIVGGNLFGIVGMLVAIPLTAVLKTILVDLKKEYQNLDIYKT